MSEQEAAMFTATYADWRIIKTRSTVAIVFEVPIEASGHAYNVLGGMPRFGSDKWFAIARMQQPENKK
jgi:hypothetical protein